MAMLSSLCKSGLVQLPTRRLLQVQGTDAARFLQGILTNDMRMLEDGGQRAIYGAFLTTKGRVLGDANVIHVQEETFWLDYDEAVDADLMKHWKRYKLRLKVKLEDKSEEFRTYAALPSLLSESGDVLSVDDGACSTLMELNGSNDPHQGAIFTDPRGAVFGTRLVLPRDQEVKTPASGDNTLDAHMYNARRLFHGVAEGKELADGIPLESNLELLQGVSFKKGCYVGQELTARTQFKGNVRKRFVPVAVIPPEEKDVVQLVQSIRFGRIDATEYAPLRQFFARSSDASTSTALEGTKLYKEGSTKAVGTIVSSAEDSKAAVAMVRLEHLTPAEEDQAAPVTKFHVGDSDMLAVPYEPLWWSNLDPKTGKMAL